MSEYDIRKDPDGKLGAAAKRIAGARKQNDILTHDADNYGRASQAKRLLKEAREDIEQAFSQANLTDITVRDLIGTAHANAAAAAAYLLEILGRTAEVSR